MKIQNDKSEYKGENAKPTNDENFYLLKYSGNCKHFSGFLRLHLMNLSQQHIVSQATTLFMSYGVKSVTMQDVSRSLGVSKKTLYQFVEGKKELIQLALKQDHDQTMTVLQKYREEAEDAIDEMERLAKYIIEMLKNLKPSVIYDLRKYYRSIHDEWKIYRDEFIYQQISRNLERGIKEGLYRGELDVDVITRFFVGKVMIILEEELFPHQEFAQSEVYKEHILYHLYGITSDLGRKKIQLINLND